MSCLGGVIAGLAAKNILLEYGCSICHYSAENSESLLALKAADSQRWGEKLSCENVDLSLLATAVAAGGELAEDGLEGGSLWSQQGAAGAPLACGIDSLEGVGLPQGPGAKLPDREGQGEEQLLIHNGSPALDRQAEYGH